MNLSTPFFSFDLRQPVNQWMCIALISLMCFWVVLFYFVNRTEAFGNSIAAASADQINYGSTDKLPAAPLRKSR